MSLLNSLLGQLLAGHSHSQGRQNTASQSEGGLSDFSAMFDALGTAVEGRNKEGSQESSEEIFAGVPTSAEQSSVDPRFLLGAADGQKPSETRHLTKPIVLRDPIDSFARKATAAQFSASMNPLDSSRRSADGVLKDPVAIVDANGFEASEGDVELQFASEGESGRQPQGVSLGSETKFGLPGQSSGAGTLTREAESQAAALTRIDVSSNGRQGQSVSAAADPTASRQVDTGTTRSQVRPQAVVPPLQSADTLAMMSTDAGQNSQPAKLPESVTNTKPEGATEPTVDAPSSTQGGTAPLAQPGEVEQSKANSVVDAPVRVARGAGQQFDEKKAPVNGLSQAKIQNVDSGNPDLDADGVTPNPSRAATISMPSSTGETTRSATAVTKSTVSQDKALQGGDMKSPLAGQEEVVQSSQSDRSPLSATVVDSPSRQDKDNIHPENQVRADKVRGLASPIADSAVRGNAQDFEEAATQRGLEIGSQAASQLSATQSAEQTVKTATNSLTTSDASGSAQVVVDEAGAVTAGPTQDGLSARNGQRGAPLEFVMPQADSRADFEESLDGVLKQMTQQSQTKAKLVLQPGTLGNVDVSLEMKDGELQLTMKAANADAQGILETAAPALRESLSVSGVQLSQLNITSDSSSGQSKESQGEQHQKDEFSKNSRDEKGQSKKDDRGQDRGESQIDVLA